MDGVRCPIRDHNRPARPNFFLAHGPYLAASALPHAKTRFPHNRIKADGHPQPKERTVFHSAQVGGCPCRASVSRVLVRHSFAHCGAADAPAEVVVDGNRYRQIELFKHDSWAATALYAGPAGRIVCKFNRVQSVCGLPMKWLGRRLAEREHRALTRAGRPAASSPTPLGAVYANGRRLRNAVARAFIAGHPLGKNEHVDRDFFAALQAALRAMHRRGIAYVDLHKRENIIVGDDGRPYLVDFQISFDATHPRLNWLPGFLFDQLCIGDLYHLEKHVRHARDSAAKYEPPEIPAWLRLHRLVAVPFRQLRRRFLVRAASGPGAVRSRARSSPRTRSGAKHHKPRDKSRLASLHFR